MMALGKSCGEIKKPPMQVEGVFAVFAKVNSRRAFAPLLQDEARQIGVLGKAADLVLYIGRVDDESCACLVGRGV